MLASSGLAEGMMIFTIITATIVLLGGTFLAILCVSRVQFSLRFLLGAIVSIAVVLGAWSAVLHTAARQPLLDDSIDPVDPARGPSPSELELPEVPAGNEIDDRPVKIKPDSRKSPAPLNDMR